MNFCKVVASVLFTCIASMSVAQSTDMFVICTYDYKQALQSNYNRPYEGDRKYSLLYVQIDAENNYDINEVDSYAEGIAKLYKRRNTVVFVHGDNANIDELISDYSQISRLYNVNVIIFSWPAKEIKSGIKNYFKAKDNVALIFDLFTKTMRDIQKCDSLKQSNVSIMFHSLGNLFAKEYAHHIVNNFDEPVFFDNIILNAPAVVSEGHELWTDVLTLKAKKNVLLNYNRNDKSLWAVDAFIEDMPLLGRDPKRPFARKMLYMNFSEALKDARSYGNSHTYFIATVPLKNKIVWAYYNTVLNGNTPDFTNVNIFAKKAGIRHTEYAFLGNSDEYTSPLTEIINYQP